ncbi:MAG: hypothetical protein ACJAS4_003576 [Bacteriovoracaceae bacterium]|jgi:hypothetical protein
MKRMTAIIMTSFPLMAFAGADLTLNQNILAQTSLKAIKNLKAKASFSYGIQYLGPSLSDSYQDGATYNRFNSGQDWQGVDTDSTGSVQLYHSFSLGYQVQKNIKLSYSATFQEDLEKDITYNNYNKDGSVWGTGSRKQGVSHNNHRVNAMVTNMYGNQYFFLMSNFYYELPTTKASKDSEMTYGLGIQPVIGIYSKVTGLYHGIKASLERDYYKRQEYTYNCGGYTCSTSNQTLRASVTGYIGYNVSDKVNWNAELTYDWDQDGDQVDNHIIYNNNMDNILEVGPNYRVNNNLTIGGRFQQAINRPSIEKSAILGKLNLSI